MESFKYLQDLKLEPRPNSVYLGEMQGQTNITLYLPLIFIEVNEKRSVYLHIIIHN